MTACRHDRFDRITDGAHGKMVTCVANISYCTDFYLIRELLGEMRLPTE